MKKILSFVIIAICFFLISGILEVNISFAEPQQDYIKGRELTEEEIEQQEAIEPELSRLPQFDDKRIVFQQPDSSILKKRTAGLESKYDVREQNYAKYVKVKDQKETGLCWAFAATSSAEISYMHKSSASGKSFSNVEFSPLHLAYFLYHRANDRLGNTGYDKNDVTGNYLQEGGNNAMTFQALANWTGLSAESKLPFDKRYSSSFSVRLAYDNDYIIKTAQFIGNDDKTATMTEIKRAIKENGSVTADMCYKDIYINRNTAAYNDNGTPASENNHIITIVGWDDNYSKNNFTGSCRPDRDGAWIVQNSYGPNWGDGGYFYISYEDISLADPMTVEIQKAKTYDYNYQYDGNACPMAFNMSKGSKAGNVFAVPSSSAYQYLGAIGFTTWNNNKTSYTVDIYTGVTGTSRPTKGTKVCSMTVTTDNAGFYTFNLPKIVTLKGGSKYSIVVTAKSNVDFGVESSFSYGWIKFRSGQKKYQSYYYAGGTWNDLYYSGGSARIKGFATEKKPISMSKAKVTLDTLYYKYTGTQRKPVPTVKYNGKYLKNGIDYTLSYGNNQMPGYGYIYISGKGDYTGKSTKKFYIARVSGLKTASCSTDALQLKWIGQGNITGYKIYRYVSGEYKYAATVKGTKSYTVKNLAPGKGYRFKVRAYVKADSKTYNGLLSGTLSAPTKPLKSVITEISTGKDHYINVYWKKRTATGYYVKIARNPDFTSNVRTYKIKTYKTISKKISKLTKGRYYYVKVRAYKTYGGKTVYGSWSGYKKIKCK